jgi:hypothetical protein
MAGRGDSPGTKRDLAQAGTLAAAILAALVSADPFDARNRASWVRHLDYIAIALWVAALVLFLFAGSPQEAAEGESAWSSLSARHWAALATAGLARSGHDRSDSRGAVPVV